MEKNDEMKDNLWIENHLAKLSPGSEWRPDVTHGLARFNERRASPNAGLRNWTWAAAATLAVSLCLVAFPAARAFTQRVWESLFIKSVDVTGVSAKGKIVKDGQRPPDFTLPDATGANIRLSAYKGKVVLLNFWATWCHGCKVEIPWFMEFAGKYQDRGLAVIGVALDEGGWKLVRPYVQEKKINYPIVVGNGDLADRYGVEGMPMTFLIGRDGKLAASHIGLVDKGWSETEITRLLGK
jgi:cytochrome c biogenesis protein CcmG/thiol:disulfide interchange protein DsbE